MYEPFGHAVHTEPPVMRHIEKRRYCKGNRAGQHTGHCTISTSIDIVQRNNWAYFQVQSFFIIMDAYLQKILQLPALPLYNPAEQERQEENPATTYKQYEWVAAHEYKLLFPSPYTCTMRGKQGNCKRFGIYLRPRDRWYDKLRIKIFRFGQSRTPQGNLERGKCR